MFRFLGVLACIVSTTTASLAHEFWIEPDQFLAPATANINASVRVGQQLDGKAFAFEPRGYQIAIWTGPDGALDLTRAPLRSDDVSLSALGHGLHRLAVVSYGQLLVHPTLTEFLHFLESIGQADQIKRHHEESLPKVEIRERYRRLSKTLVHFEAIEGIDNRIGLQREWVAIGGRFTLYDGEDPAIDRVVDVFCRQGQSVKAVTNQRLRTDSDGTIAPILPPNADCLLNSVFLETAQSDVIWQSDWVSLFFQSDIFVE